MNKGDMLL